jgi:hypothetical protein
MGKIKSKRRDWRDDSDTARGLLAPAMIYVP